MPQDNKYTNWLITHNNPKMSLEQYLEMWYKVSKYVNGQIESGKEDTIHIQAYISLKKPDRLTAMKRMDPRAHFEPVKFDNGASEYCMKTETRLEGPIELGEKPLLRQSKRDWTLIKKKAKEGKLEEIPDDIYVQHYGNLKKIEKDHQTIPKRTFPKKCYWLWGDPRTGKTRKARHYEDGEEPPYIKKVDKWWDGYQGQKKVVIDDMGPKRGECIVDDLKLWADDWYNQPGQTKGG